MKSPSPTTTAVWTRLLHAHSKAFGEVEARLKDAHMPPLCWYDILLELSRSKKALKAHELQKKLLLPQYFMSRTLTRLNQAGYIDKRSCSVDARTQLLQITNGGRQIRERMWLIYGPAIHSVIGDKLSPEEASDLARLLKKLTT